ncbi:hypothetical protein [Streptomyces sp. NPDC015350]|uniref:hypothetical protein n=1 Tax=Streptomyces sp. NPDC015350 TaxID=3364955 RepID=UPI0036F99079
MDVANTEGLQLRPGPLGARRVAGVEDGDLQRDAAPDGLDDVGARSGVGSPAGGDRVVLGRDAAVVGRREPDAGLLQ